MTTELAKVYDPKSIEKEIYEYWTSRGAFNAEPDGSKPKYCIVIPPPNVTAALHLGHALNNALQDVLIRVRRMQGYNALWMPGTDHAGIATQTVVEKRILAEEGKRRTDFQRPAFVQRIQAWKDEYEQRILNQLQKMGCSCDWRRTRFTMDEVCAKAVRATFFKLFSDGLIYRGKRLVNWDPATQTVLADDEVEYEEIQGHFYYMKYPLEEPVNISGTGVPPVRPTDVPSVADDDYILKRQGAYLPHWTKPGAKYAIAFRLADALPKALLDSWRMQREDIVQRAKHLNRPLTAFEEKELARLYSTRVEAYLDSGSGECHLRDPRIAQIVLDAIKHFHGQRYDLIAWCIMPNHVHVIIRPLPGNELPDILKSWKSFTAKQANTLLGRTGSFWQEEYYDHLIRDEEDFNNQVNYILGNPIKAGLSDWPWRGANKGQGQDDPATHGRDAHATIITHIVVATTRPETMLGDTAVAMNPADPRAKFLVGKMVRLPIVGRLIPIIADNHVVLPNPESDDEKARFSTGFLKVTPAHDPDDWAIGQRHSLPVINVMAPDGTISDKHGWTDWEQVKNADAENLIGMDRFEARQAVLEWFREEGLLENVRDYTHQVGHSYRSHVPIEPYLSDQWYIAVKKPIPGLEAAMAKCRLSDEQVEKRDGAVYIKGTDVPVDSLAGLALMPLLDGRVKFTPDRYANNYRTWLENLRDWPISRQLWWGHQIPVWYFEPQVPSSALRFPDIASCRNREYQDCLEDALNKLATLERLAETTFLVGGDRDSWKFWICSATTDGDELLGRVVDLKKDFEAHSAGAGPAKRNPRFLSDESKLQAIRCMEMFDKIQREEDVLDTWFSSALWPFSTLGWPEQTDALKTWYPGDVLCTAREIITLWVSRMVMMGQYCAGDIPFRDVFIHAMIQDGEGRKMSKSLGNGIDPLDIIDSHGADAMRFTLVSMTTQTQDVRMPVETMTLPDGRKMNTSPKFDIGRNFANKLWNASRFAMMNLAGMPAWSQAAGQMELSDRWIISRLAETIRDVTAAVDNFRFNEMADTLYHFMWDDFCDWYLEIAKSRINAGQAGPKAIVAHCLDMILRMLHPIMPFITEAIWSNLNAVAPVRAVCRQDACTTSRRDACTTSGSDACTTTADAQAEAMLITAAWPKADEAAIDAEAMKEFDLVRELVRAIRNARTQHNVPPGKSANVMVQASDSSAQIVQRNAALMASQANLQKVELVPSGTAIPANSAAILAGDIKLYVLDIIDRDAELARLTKQAGTLQKGIAGIEGKLGNAGFVAKAPPAVVEKERQRLEGLKAELAAVEHSLKALQS